MPTGIRRLLSRPKELRKRTSVWKPGTLIEFDLDEVFVAGLYTHDLDVHGQVIRLFAAKSPSPLDLNPEAIRASGYFTSIKFPLLEAGKSRSLRNLGVLTMTPDERKYPVFRSPAIGPNGEPPPGWWIVGRRRDRFVSTLTGEQEMLPVDGIYNLTAIRDLFDDLHNPYDQPDRREIRSTN